MHDLAPEPIPTGRQIIQFEADTHPAEMYGAIEGTTGLIASAGDTPDVDVPVLPKLGLAIAELNSSQARALSENECVAQVRPEFYLFDWTTIDDEAVAYLREGALRYIESLIPGAPQEPSEPLPSKEQAARFADTPQMTWGLQAIGADKTALTGAGIKVCVLDTGIDTGHPDFMERPITAKTFVNGEYHDGNGHGTHVAGTIAGPCQTALGRRYGVAPGVELYVGKVLANNGAGREFDVLSGIEWALAEGCHIISMSLGRAVRRGEKPDPLYERVGQVALDRDCLIIAAAGNESSRAYGYTAPVGSPANAETIMAVGSVDPLMRVSSFSCGGINPGGAVDIAAPGSSVFSAWPVPRQSRTISGTSMATPHVAGVAALIAQETGARGHDLWHKLINGAEYLGNTSDFGAGLVRAPAASW